MTPADVLDAAADMIEARGLSQHADWGSNGELCAGRSILTVNDGSGVGIAYSRFSEFCGGSVVTWNDHPGRTADEVAEALRKCAAAARWDEV